MTKEEKEIAENITNFCNFMCEENLEKVEANA